MVYPYNIQSIFKGEVERSMCIAIYGTKQTQTSKYNRTGRLTLTARHRRFFSLSISAPNLSFPQSSYYAILRQVSSAVVSPRIMMIRGLFINSMDKERPAKPGLKKPRTKPPWLTSKPMISGQTVYCFKVPFSRTTPYAGWALLSGNTVLRCAVGSLEQSEHFSFGWQQSLPAKAVSKS